MFLFCGSCDVNALSPLMNPMLFGGWLLFCSEDWLKPYLGVSRLSFPLPVSVGERFFRRSPLIAPSS